MHKLVIVRHGESVWNLENRFTGWTDVDLSAKGMEEARQAGVALREYGFEFDIAYTSLLKRAVRTLWLILDAMDRIWLPVHHSWRLNERHYGALQGLNKKKVAAELGEEKIRTLRRGYDIRPPPLEQSDARYPGNDPRYKHLSVDEIPLAESLKDTVERMLPFWHAAIAPAITEGKKVIVSAHGNSLRGLIQYLDGLSFAEVIGLEVPTGTPIVYELDDNLKKIRRYFLSDA